MPRRATPPEAPPALDTLGTLGVILHCQNRVCRHRAWLDPPAFRGLTAPDLQRRGRCKSCGSRACSVEVVDPSPVGMKASQPDDARAARLKQWIEDHPVG